jgi:hypothetical protein
VLKAISRHNRRSIKLIAVSTVRTAKQLGLMGLCTTRPTGNRSLRHNSSRRLTKQKYELTAIATLTQVIRQKRAEYAWRGTYVAGLWLRTLLEGMCWNVRTGKRLDVYWDQAWSWVTLDARICYNLLEEPVCLAYHENHHVQPVATDPCWEVKNAWVELHAVLLPIPFGWNQVTAGLRVGKCTHVLDLDLDLRSPREQSVYYWDTNEDSTRLKSEDTVFLALLHLTRGRGSPSLARLLVEQMSQLPETAKQGQQEYPVLSRRGHCSIHGMKSTEMGLHKLKKPRSKNSCLVIE